jgi:hypothetical protein
MEHKGLIPKRDNDWSPFSRDYCLEKVIKCGNQKCPAWQDGYCSVPSLIRINSKAQCKTGIAYLGISDE